MESLVILVVIVVIVFFLFAGMKKEFDDPKAMTNHQLVSAIAGQADWLEKMSRSPIASQSDTSIVEIARKRRGYIGKLCLEVVSRGLDGPKPGEQKYPGATKASNVFAEVSEYAKAKEATGLTKEIAAMRAVKQKLIVENGLSYPTSWEQ